MIKTAFCLMVFFVISTVTTAETVVTVRAPESPTDKRYDYDNAVIKLALDKTVSKYGPYRIVLSPVLTYAQALEVLANNTLNNFVMKNSYSQDVASQSGFVEFPVDLGIVGYRVCFTSVANKPRLAEVRTIDDLKAFTNGQGTGWADVEILRQNGFNVREVAHYESLFLLTAHGSIDLFCRGTNELLPEYEEFKKFPDLTYDETFSLAYPLPRFLFTSKQNQELIKRLDEGIKMAYADGSLQQLWLANYQDSINFVRLDKRKIFYIDNPLLKGLSDSYKQYMYKP
ncbi:hypothetical protein [Gynuella sunshinyii]|uniref:ABC-type amino acid transport/signal transduction system, periplasmic component/domain n=1 Tax=Gynuella sunshinyii YC6258 TaxID=1445510 RepID=A0A0C5VFG9_9GAMM|nr:hypothetical protein [Gynuella sunshinyii]AJQ93277.1 hypothetical Protein YC6258_01229 [Gynuella sunshinyii YC6258]